MTPEARSRIQTAVELSPDRRCVTIRRDDGQGALGEIDRLIADVEHYKTAAIRLEAMLTHSTNVVQDHVVQLAEMTARRDRAAQAAKYWREIAGQRQASAEPLIHPLALMPHAWMLYGLSAFAGALVDHG